MNKFIKVGLAAVVFAGCQLVLGAEQYFTDFARKKWNKADWQIIKSPRWNYVGEFVQLNDCIANQTPNLPDEEIFKKHVNKVYSCMALKKQFKGDCAIQCTMSFDHRMAPSILIASGFGKSSQGAMEQRDHFEIVLYDGGINIWHHYYKDGKPSWRKAAFIECKYEAKKQYKLKAIYRKTAKGKELSVICNNQRFGYMDDSLPDSYFVGIIGCEGRNRFYDFKINTDKKFVKAQRLPVSFPE